MLGLPVCHKPHPHFAPRAADDDLLARLATIPQVVDQDASETGRTGLGWAAHKPGGVASSMAPTSTHARLFQDSRPFSASWTPDRKSTRLNSSHLGISYAVFCLKK